MQLTILLCITTRAKLISTGGNFWDGRASGYRLQNSSAHQAQGPPLDTQEMANPDSACVVWNSRRALTSRFSRRFGGADLAGNCLALQRRDHMAAQPAGRCFRLAEIPLRFSSARLIALSLTRTSTNSRRRLPVTRVSDSVQPLHVEVRFTILPAVQPSPRRNRTGTTCSEARAAATPAIWMEGRARSWAEANTGQAASLQPLFTTQTYNNLGLPEKCQASLVFRGYSRPMGFYRQPLGFGFTDLGMGIIPRRLLWRPPDLSWGVLEPKFDGKFQTSTARNAAQVPYAGFVKAYMHNGYLTSLKEVVHFYNTRDVIPLQRAVWSLPRRNHREGDLLADAGRP